jgi:hypothetical protein
VTANLFTQAGIPLSEPLAFGIGAGLFFGFFPFLKMDRLPLTTYRSLPGSIFSRAGRELGVRIVTRKFRDPGDAMKELDRFLESGGIAGLQVGVYWLPFLPEALRFHFNAHNLVVVGKQEEEYLVSDPLLDRVVRCPARALRKARFAQGALAPNGRMYYIEQIPAPPDLPRAIRRGIRWTCFSMLYALPPYLGVWGISALARHLRQWPRKLETPWPALHLGQVIRMQEEIGTGGAGFRYLYAAFLQEAAEILNRPILNEFSREMTRIGDLWTRFAVEGARFCKGRASENVSFDELALQLDQCAREEKTFFRNLRRAL